MSIVDMAYDETMRVRNQMTTICCILDFIKTEPEFEDKEVIETLCSMSRKVISDIDDNVLAVLSRS